MIDTHCHLNDKKFEGEVDQVVNRFLLSGGKKAICVGWDIDSSIKAKEIASNYECVYYAIGVHPDECEKYDENAFKKITEQNNDKLVAIGEMGLDYFHNKNNKERQKQVFVAQINIAKALNLPFIIHCRDAFGDTLDLLKQNAPYPNGFVMHCFSGSLEFANEIIKLGGKISMTGSVTFKNAKNLHEVASNLPNETFFFETDSPYLTPEPNRGKRNEPANVKDVLKFVANLRNSTYEQLEKQTDENATKFFKIF